MSDAVRVAASPISMLHVTLALAMLSLIALAQLSAQGSAAAGTTGLAQGQRIRIKTVDSTGSSGQTYGGVPFSNPTSTTYTTQIGTVAWARADTIAFRPEGGRADSSSAIVVPGARIARLDISLGEHRNPITGLWIGAVSGVVVGAGLGAAGCNSSKNEFLSCSPGGGAAAGAVVFGLAGLVIGTGIGALIKSEKWQRVPGYPVPRVTVVPLPRGVGYGLAFNL